MPRAAAIVTGSKPRACAECLRRAWLIGSLAGHIENAVEDTPGSRAHELLALPNEDLARALAGSRAKEYLERAAASDPARMRAAVTGASAWACCRHDELFPGALAELGDQPAVLFGRGDTELLAGLRHEDAVTIVGSRRSDGGAIPRTSAFPEPMIMKLSGEPLRRRNASTSATTSYCLRPGRAALRKNS